MNRMKNIPGRTLAAMAAIVFILAADLGLAAVFPMGLSTPVGNLPGLISNVFPGDTRLLLLQNGDTVELRDEISGRLPGNGEPYIEISGADIVSQAGYAAPGTADISPLAATVNIDLGNTDPVTIDIVDGTPGTQYTVIIASTSFFPITISDANAINVIVGSGAATVTINNPNPASTLTSLTIYGGSGSDTFSVTPNSVPITINGGNPAPPSLPGDTLNLVAGGAADPLLSVAADANGYYGTWTFSNRQSVTFSAIETLAPPCESTSTVSNTNDSGAGSLRQAIASLCPGGTIDFNITYPATIPLTSGELVINKDLTITGPGSSSLTVQRSSSAVTDFRIFNIGGGSTVSISGMTIANGSNPGGGGVYNAGTLNVSGCDIRDNHAAGSGGPGFGGGIWSSGTLNVTTSSFTNNQAGSMGGYGGGIYAMGTAVISNSTFSDNRTLTDNGGGGAIYLGAGSLNLTNSTVSGNSTESTGGGIFILSGGSLTVTNSTISGNSASNGSGGGIFILSGGSLTMTSSIIAANAGFSNCSFISSITDNGNNIEDGNSCGFINPTSKINTDPMLDPAGLRDNGGPTQTIALLPGSPAIDAIPPDINGRCSSSPSDQRGVARQQGGSCDIGAYESRGFTFGTRSGTPQSTAINTVFATPLGVAVLSAFGEPVDGGTITFNAPLSGASVTSAPAATAIIAGGVASVGVTANATIGGPYVITAAARGVSGAATFSLTNDAVPTTTTLTSSPNPSFFGQPVTFTATVTSGATGAVAFTEGAATLCAASPIIGATATCVTATLASGDHIITATYSGDASFAGSSTTTSHTVLFQYLLNVARTGSGRIRSAIAGIEGNGINCGSHCMETYNQGAVVNLTAIPSTGWLFREWSGSCSGSGSCAVTMDASRSVTAAFVEETSVPITGIRARAYEPVTYAIPGLIFVDTSPIGIGPYAIGRDRVWINIGMKAFPEPSDLYFVLRMPSTDPEGYYVLKEDSTFSMLTEGIFPWKKGHTASIAYEDPFGIISGMTLPSGTYELYMMATPTGKTDTYQIWETAFDIPFSDLMPLPGEGLRIVHQPGAFPTRSTDPAMANPVGFGSVAVNAKEMGLSANASMGDSVELKIGLEGFDGPTDIYFGIYMPDYEPNDMYILRQDGVVRKLSEGLVSWKSGQVGPVEQQFGSVSVSSLPKGRYVLYLLATPQGRMDTWYMWESQITIP